MSRIELGQIVLELFDTGVSTLDPRLKHALLLDESLDLDSSGRCCWQLGLNGNVSSPSLRCNGGIGRRSGGGDGGLKRGLKRCVLVGRGRRSHISLFGDGAERRCSGSCLLLGDGLLVHSEGKSGLLLGDPLDRDLLGLKSSRKRRFDCLGLRSKVTQLALERVAVCNGLLLGTLDLVELSIGSLERAKELVSERLELGNGRPGDIELLLERLG
jgi:hypothetical protein